MNKEKFLIEIEQYLLNNNWNKHENNGKIYYIKNGQGILSPRKKKISINRIFSIIQKELKLNIPNEFHFDSVVNTYKDTDYVIACLQMLNKYLIDDTEVHKNEYYSFQPVIRKINNGEFIDGNLSSFVNVGTIYLDAKLADYFKELELWITIMSRCSIYVNGIKLQIKDKTNAYNGIGLQFFVGNIEIGQCNLYDIKFKDDIYRLVTDFGFGLERICWAANGYKDFKQIFQRLTDYYNHNHIYSDKVSTCVLLIMSGVKPNSSKYGIKLRKLLSDVYQIGLPWDYEESLNFYYNYWKTFIDSKIDRDILLSIFKKEMNYQQNYNIISENNLSVSQKKLKNSTDELIEYMIINHLYNGHAGFENDK